MTSNKLQGASTLCDALKERYDCEQMFNDGEYTVDTTMGKGKVIELVGADKTRRQQKLSSIEKVDLSVRMEDVAVVVMEDVGSFGEGFGG